MRTEPDRAMAVSPELVPSELQEKMVAAFEHARAERLAAQIPQDGAGQAGDPWTRANTAAFLILEREHRAIAARLCRPYWRRGDRYRDLVLVTELIRVEYEHLAGRVGKTAGPPAPPNGALAGDDMPAGWARPWGSGPMVEIGTALIFYEDQRDRLATRLSARTAASAAADAEEHRDRILSRFKRAMGEWKLELEHGRAAAADSGKREAAPPTAEAAGQKRAWPWASPRFTRWAAAAGAVFVAVGAGAILAQTRGGESPVGAPSAVVASAPEPLTALGERSRKRPARGRDARHGAAHRSKAHQRDRGNEAGQAAAASATPPPAPEPAPEAPPASVAPAAPVANPAPPPPPTSDDEPAPSPDPKPRPGPVSTLPPPGGGLPAPGGSGDGGG